MANCPYCQMSIPAFYSRTECPQCAREVLNVACPHCSRRTINLTHVSRYGHATCFYCHTSITELPPADDQLPEAPPVHVYEPVTGRLPDREGGLAHPALTITVRAPKTMNLPTVVETRKTMEECLVGLERAAQDRDLLRTPDLRVVLVRFLDSVHSVLALDDQMESGEVTEEWLHEPVHLQEIARLCYIPLWPFEAALLPPVVQAWTLAVEDAARRWQYGRRQWLAETFGLTLMPTVPAITTTNPSWHEITGPGQVVAEVLSPGFLLHGEVVRKALVRGG